MWGFHHFEVEFLRRVSTCLKWKPWARFPSVKTQWSRRYVENGQCFDKMGILNTYRILNLILTAHRKSNRFLNLTPTKFTKNVFDIRFSITYVSFALSDWHRNLFFFQKNISSFGLSSFVQQNSPSLDSPLNYKIIPLKLQNSPLDIEFRGAIL